MPGYIDQSSVTAWWLKIRLTSRIMQVNLPTSTVYFLCNHLRQELSNGQPVLEDMLEQYMADLIMEQAWKQPGVICADHLTRNPAWQLQVHEPRFLGRLAPSQQKQIFQILGKVRKP